MSKEVVLVQCSSGHRNWIEPEALPMLGAYYCAICGKQILTPSSVLEPLTNAEMKAQASRCGCRGTDDYCPCQNAPDATTVSARRSSDEQAEVVGWRWPNPMYPDLWQYTASDPGEVAGKEPLYRAPAVAAGGVTEEMVRRAIAAHDPAPVGGNTNYLSYTDAERMRRALTAALAVRDEGIRDGADACPVCAVAFKPDDMCQTDIELGTCHAACLEGAPLVDLDTGDPLPEGSEWPAPYRYDSLPTPPLRGEGV